MTDVVTLGETMLRLTASKIGPLTHSPSMQLGMGGAESNVAIGLSRLGVNVTWLSRLGADSAGDHILRELQGERVTVVAARDEGAPTGVMLKERRTPDTVSVAYYRSGSAASRMTPENLDLAPVAGARLLHVTGITPALSEGCRRTTVAAIERARDAGVAVSLDLNFRRRLWSADEAAHFYRSVMNDIDIVFAGEEEAKIATGVSGSPESLAAALRAMGARTVVIKLGERGALALCEGRTDSVPAIAITPVDTVGAGDAFVAGYLAEHLAGGPPQQSLETGVKTGAFACLSDGDWEGSARRDELALLTLADPVIR